MTGETRAALIAAAIPRLRLAGVESPERDARLLLRWAAGLEAADFSARLAEPAAAEEASRFDTAVTERIKRRPVAQITGRRIFWGREFRVTADVLDPRPETEVLIAAALEGPPAARILDLGTGSGCILLTLLAEWSAARGLGTDASEKALSVAAENAAALAVAERAEFRLVDWCENLKGSFELVVSNPPYLAAGEIFGLQEEVRCHEPRGALVPESDPGDGLEAYRRIAAGLPPLLAPGGRILLEIGPAQAAAVTTLLAAAGLSITGLRQDLDGRDRVLMASSG